MRKIMDAVAGLRIGEPASYGNLTVFPLFGGAQAAADYLTLDEALALKCAVITEVSEGGSVPELQFVNSGGLPVFLLDGEELIGAKQNRIINISILVAAAAKLVVPVSCVEAGRWAFRGRRFAASPRAHYAEGRARKTAQVSASMRATGRRRSDQTAIWRDISEKSARFRVASETSAMSDIFEQESRRLEDYVCAFAAREGQRGAVFAIRGKIAGLDLFDSPETLRKLLPKLLRSYGLDALDRGRSGAAKETRCTGEEVGAFIQKVAGAKAEEFPAVGEGRDIRLSAAGLTGAALFAGNRVIHLTAFPMGD